MIYGVYENKALVHWPPSKIFGDEITVSRNLRKTPVFTTTHHYRDTTLSDHRFVLANLLLPPRGTVPRQREDQDQGNGHRRVQAGRLPAGVG